MKARSRPSWPLLCFLLFSALFSLQVWPGIFSNSLTNDEPSDITNGYFYLTRGDVASIQSYPPLSGALQALPLLFLPLKTPPFQGDWIDRSHRFIFDWNLDHLGAITVLSRSISWLLGLGVGALLAWATRKEPLWCAFTLFFWALDPTLLALAGLAKTDIAPTFFILAAVLLFEKAKKEGTWKWALAAGWVTAMAITSKYYALILVPLFVILEIEKRSKLEVRKIKGRWGWGTLGFIIWLILLYLPATLLLPDHREPFAYFFIKLKENWLYAKDLHPVYFWGQSGLTNHWYYLPVAFILKEPLPFLLPLLWVVTLVFRGRIQLPAWQWTLPLLFGLALLPTPNLGVRYLLPALPFLFLITGRGMAWVWEARRKFPWGLFVVVFLSFWQAGSLAWNFPNYLSYFNELVPAGRKIFFLGDSNLDWGQDLGRLAAVARERKWGRVKLAYMGGIEPKAYGLDWEPWTEEDLKGPQPGTVYAVNASFFQLAPAAYPSTRALAEGWISRAEPTGKVADIWYFFESPGEPKEKDDSPLLASVPFLQYRGYAYPMKVPPP